jgi:hypothetical protein
MDASFRRIKIRTTQLLFLKSVFIFLLLQTVTKGLYAQQDSLNQPKKELFTEPLLGKFNAYRATKNNEGLQDIADRNGYPSPQKVLQWQKVLLLNDRQKTSIGSINKELLRKVNEMNNFLITNERTMDSLFRYKKINNGTLIYYTNRYGLYHGELRNAVLQACVKTEAILTASQIKKYAQLLKD